MIPSNAPFGFGAVNQAFRPMQMQQPVQSNASSFWQSANVQEHLRKLQETIEISKSMLIELEAVQEIRNGQDHSNNKLLEIINQKKISLDAQQSLSIEAANSIYSQIKTLLFPFASVSNQNGAWEERSLMVKLSQKMQKSKRNKLWRKRKRKRIAELISKEREDYDKLDQEADEWRAKEIAEDIARRKVESMKEIAKKKANEEKKRLESELELVLIVEKLKELRSIRIQKLKKQGHFFPEEDDKFLDRVKASVEEEERQSKSKSTISDAIATAMGSAKSTDQMIEKSTDLGAVGPSGSESKEMKVEEGNVKSADSGAGLNVNLPAEFYHYYYGGSYDMGTLIEVRRTWDAYLRPGGSRIPGHWVQPPPPSNEVWASYLVPPK
ncbi:hypothetical protein LUZ60_010049 [Juncus effusus]|nr:hypothetical protein LUZ60_010049 [Juncus effusus]